MQEQKITITHNIQASLFQFFTTHTYSKIAIICDENTEQYCLPKVIHTLPTYFLLRISSGEANKHLGTCKQLWQALTDAGFDRKSLVINLGGGVIGDMGGFVASTYKRGIDFLNIPTTLLSQVDACIGGKLGVDFNGLKNHIGLFATPKEVLICTHFLETLPKREIYSGFAEVIKHGLIYDYAYWKTVTNIDPTKADWAMLIDRSIAIKKEVVATDPYEKGLRKILNFGHTLGHAVESYFLNSTNRLLHGEAIAVGMICETYLSTQFAGLSLDECDEIVHYLLGIYKPIAIKPTQFATIVHFTSQDKKNEGGAIRFSLLSHIGTCISDVSVGNADMLDALFYFDDVVKKQIRDKKYTS